MFSYFFAYCPKDLSCVFENWNVAPCSNDEVTLPVCLSQSAAALCVGVGSFSDPDHLPGLAHFLEHSECASPCSTLSTPILTPPSKPYRGRDVGSEDIELYLFF